MIRLSKMAAQRTLLRWKWQASLPQKAIDIWACPEGRPKVVSPPQTLTSLLVQ
ncbi:Uncharacterised protein [uncultured archaeon]|nr:Uncharacterised protein [uncultured archaeon]